MVVAIGDEVVSGRVADRNTRWLSRNLEGAGHSVMMAVSIPDTVGQIADLIRWGSRRFVVVVTTGGLSATPDDVTRSAIAEGLGRPLQFFPEALELTPWAARNVDFARRIASFPSGAVPVVGIRGGVLGFGVENVVSLPGSPPEMRACYRHATLPRGGRPKRSVTLNVGRTEDQIAPYLDQVDKAFPAVRVGSYPVRQGPEPRVDLVLTSHSDRALNQAATWLRRSF